MKGKIKGRMKGKSDEYWMKKIQLFMTLHGIWGNFEHSARLDEILCVKCPHNNIPMQRQCELLVDKNGKRWEFAKGERKLFRRSTRAASNYNEKTLCAEWVRYL